MSCEILLVISKILTPIHHRTERSSLLTMRSSQFSAELENSDLRLSGRVKWYLYWLGFIPHFFSWIVILGYFFYSLTKGYPPAFVYSIIFIIFLLDLSFAIILALQWMGKKYFRPYVKGEIAFIILSFTSKNLLAWINFFGGNR